MWPIVVVAATFTASALAGGSAAPGPALVKTALNQKLGKRIVVDSQGRTLYMFTADSGGKSNCTVDFLNCPTVWPPLITGGKPRAGAGIAAAKLGTTKRRDGRLQVTYNRHPLYRFASDRKPGDAKGQKYLGTWFVLSPKGTPIR